MEWWGWNGAFSLRTFISALGWMHACVLAPETVIQTAATDLVIS